MKTSTKFKRRQDLTALCYVLPAVVFMGVFVLIPVIFSLVMSFYKIEALGATWEFIGFKNFAYVFEEKEFVNAFFRTIGFGAYSVVIGLIQGLILALLVAGDRRLNFFRYIFYVPGVVSAITMGMLWQQIMEPTKLGMLNKLFIDLGILEEPFTWLNSTVFPQTWIIYLLMGLIGGGGGMTLILFTTAINNISVDIKEAAYLEGATNWQMTTKITLPLISPTISSWVLLSIIGSLKSFEGLYALTGGGPDKQTTTLAILLFQNEKSSILGYGYSSAMGLFMTIIVLVFTGAYYWLVSLKERKEASV